MAHTSSHIERLNPQKKGVRETSPFGMGFKSHPARICLYSAPFEMWLCERVKRATAKGYAKMVRLLSKIGDIEETSKIRTLICTSQVSEARKQLLAQAYDYYCQYKGLQWTKPRFIREDKAFFLPLESELDALIQSTRLKMSAFLQLLKETGVNSGEAWKLRWIDIDVQRKTVNVTPTKGHNARVLPISNNLLSRLLRLPRKNERVFASKNLDKFRWLYERARNILSLKLDNPRIHQIAFRSFRHWKATHEYHRTKDILHVQWLLGHKRLENTLVYAHRINFESDDYTCKVAKTVEEATQLIESGFEYVMEIDDAKLFRKPK